MTSFLTQDLTLALNCSRPASFMALPGLVITLPSLQFLTLTLTFASYIIAYPYFKLKAVAVIEKNCGQTD